MTDDPELYQKEMIGILTRLQSNVMGVEETVLIKGLNKTKAWAHLRESLDDRKLIRGGYDSESRKSVWQINLEGSEHLNSLHRTKFEEKQVQINEVLAFSAVAGLMTTIVIFFVGSNFKTGIDDVNKNFGPFVAVFLTLFVAAIFFLILMRLEKYLLKASKK